MHEVSIHEDADDELKAAALFYESRESGLGETFLDELASSFRLLREYPLSCNVLFEEYRRCRVRQFPYGVVYRIEGERVIVLAVAHSSRRPGYWRERR